VPRFKRYNPDLTFFIYVDSGLNPGFSQADAGSVDEQDTAWIVENHPEWLLHDQYGDPIRSAGGLSNQGEYWPDPGNPDWQAFFAVKVDDTLFAFYCYLLIADRNREIYWTHKEGTSDIPHYWYQEFDLDLGAPEGDVVFGDLVWSRAFSNAVVIVNPGREPAGYHWPVGERFYDVEGNLLESPVALDGRSAFLLVSSPAILP
jgi:hypothetical protein